MRRVAILGSTGSIGTQTLDVIAQHPDRLQVVGLAAARSEAELAAQAERFGVRHTALYARDGIEGLERIATLEEADIVVLSVAGVIGLRPTLAAIEAGKDIALASKEVLVAAGEVVMPRVRAAGVAMTPIDSEHSAIFQCLRGYRPDQVAGLILTASGGPFRGRTRASLEGVTLEEALAHPTWRMGGKITIDSATLMNKGLETLEARWLFDVPIERIDAVVHPQSVVHSLVRLNDGSVLGQLGWPDMRLPILVALTHPDRVEAKLPPWNPVDTPNLTFEPVDHDALPGIAIARESAARGGTAPCAMNAANEEAVALFLRGEIRFLQIFEIVRRVLEAHQVEEPTLDNLLRVDAQARESARMLSASA